ncbi:hypothetical protein, partial [Acinetobacter baumannii]
YVGFGILLFCFVGSGVFFCFSLFVLDGVAGYFFASGALFFFVGFALGLLDEFLGLCVLVFFF